MPLKDTMSEERVDRAIEKVLTQMSACQTGRRKLRQRRDTVEGLSNAELLLIKLEMTRLDFKIDLLMDRLDAFEQNEKPLPAPSKETIKKMKAQVEKIRKIVVKNKTATTIMNAVIEVAGQMPQSNLS